MTSIVDFWKAWGQTNSIYSDWANSKNINYYELFVLYALDNNKAMTQKKICDYTGLVKQTVNSVIKTLKSNEYILLSSNLEDGREKPVTLTENGKKYAKKLLTPLYDLENSVFKIMGSDRAEQMIESIMLFNTIFKKEMEDKIK